MPKRDTDPLVGNIVPDLLTRKQAITAKVKKDGFAISDGHLFRGFSAISAPIFDHTAALAGSITLLGLGAQIDRSPKGPLVSEVLDVAHELRKRVGNSLLR